MNEASIIRITQEIAEYLNTRGIEFDGQPLAVEVDLVPDFDLRQVKGLKAIAVPQKYGASNAARDKSEYMAVVNIGVVRRATKAELPELLSLVERIGKSLERCRIPSGIGVGIEYDPLYDVNAIQTKLMFLSVCSVTVKVIS